MVAIVSHQTPLCILLIAACSGHLLHWGGACASSEQLQCVLAFVGMTLLQQLEIRSIFLVVQRATKAIVGTQVTCWMNVCLLETAGFLVRMRRFLFIFPFVSIHKWTGVHGLQALAQLDQTSAL